MSPGGGNAELGPGPEFDRIRAILATLGNQARGIGDDCALVAAPSGETLVWSTDLSLEGVHFRREWMSLEEIGWRSTAAALSDLAAEGAGFVGLLASIGTPDSDPSALQRLMKGVGDAAAAARGPVLGGDLARAERLILNITVLGSAPRPVPRTGAVPGDSLWVTGTLGGARAALHAWLAGGEPEPAARERFVRPIPRLECGQALAREGARAMIDLSDGLAADAAHLAAASGVRLVLELERLPLGPGVPARARAEQVEPAAFAASGGEDYELLVALPEGVGERMAHEFSRTCAGALTRVGRVEAGQGTVLSLAGEPVRVSGFDHFA